MKQKVLIESEIEITHIEISVPVEYEEEDMPNDFPFRDGDTWKIRVNIDTGAIEGWPPERPYDLHMKVIDGGTYTLFDNAKEVGIIEENYVPHGVVPGEYGDYIILSINESGKITNWPKTIDLEGFFPERE